MSNAPGWNIQPGNLNGEQKGYINNFTWDVHPGCHLVINAAGFAGGLKALHPEVEILSRVMKQGGRTDDFAFEDETPTGFTERNKKSLLETGHDDIIIVVGNEFGVDNQKAIDWQMDVLEKFKLSGLRGCFMNNSTGNLSPKNIHLYEGLIRASHQRPDEVFLGPHEYSPPNYWGWYPNLFGNFTYILDYAKKINCPDPSIFITEWLYDTKWDRTFGQWNIKEAIIYFGSEEDAAMNRVDAYINIYEQVKQIKGLCGFAYGNDGGSVSWDDFNVAHHPTFLKTFKDGLVYRPIVEPPPIPIPSGIKTTLQHLPVGSLNFRTAPGQENEVITQLVNGSVVYLQEGIQHKDGWTWHEAILPNLRKGWFAAVEGIVSDPQLPLLPAPNNGFVCDTLEALQLYFGCK